MDWSNPHFAEPKWLWLAVLGSLAVVFLQAWSERRRKQQLASVASSDALARLVRSHSPARRLVKNGMLVLTALGLGISLARPQWGQIAEKGQTLGHDVVFVLDCSRSMLATDVSPNRLDRARLAILDFMRGGGVGRVGLVTFAGQAFIQCPLTFDRGAFRDSLEAVDERTIAVLGTDIGRALEEAFVASEKRKGPKVVILVTDGEDLEKGGIRVAERLAKEELVVYAIGIGTPSGSELRVANERGSPETLRDAEGQVVVSKLDEATLRKVAASTGGAYFPMGSMGEGLMRVQTLIQDSAARLGSSPVKKLGVDRFHIPLALVVMALVIESLIGTRRTVRESK